MAEQRSKPYPSITINEAVLKIEQIYQKLGNSKSYERSTFAQGMGYKDANNGAFLRAVAALTHYGFVVREGGKYSLTPLARKMLIPTDESDKSEAILAAALSPQLFAAVYSEYKGQVLPALLKNILVTNFGILDGAKSKAEAVFRKTMEEVSLLDGDFLIDKDKQHGTEEAAASSVAASTKTIESSIVSSVEPLLGAAAPTTSFTKNFGEGRIAQLVIPTDISAEEREKLITLLENM